jgi:glycosyltransferase involved in cell wall biosynthesis
VRISVVIPTYNRSALAVEAVQSVLDQSRPPDEVIVVDDGSTDDTADALSPFRDRIRYLAQDHAGVSSSRNAGIGLAANDWLAFLDSDDLWRPHKLERQCAELGRSPETAICYTDEEWRRHGRWQNQSKHHRKTSGWIYQHCLPLCIISPSSVLIHRRVFTEVGLFDVTLPACEDYDLWLRVTLRFPVLYIAERLIVKRAGPWPQLSMQHSLDKYRITALANMLHKERLSTVDRDATIATLREKCRIYSMGCRKHGREEEAEWADQMAAARYWMSRDQSVRLV